jgi:hypothetical protein
MIDEMSGLSDGSTEPSMKDPVTFPSLFRAGAAAARDSQRRGFLSSDDPVKSRARRAASAMTELNGAAENERRGRKNHHSFEDLNHHAT